MWLYRLIPVAEQQVGLTVNALREIRQLKREVDALRRDNLRLKRAQNTTVDMWKGKTTTAHNKGASQDVDLYAGDKGSETTTGVTVSAYNSFADVDTGKWCVVAYIDGWELISAEC